MIVNGVFTSSVFPSTALGFRDDKTVSLIEKNGVISPGTWFV